MKWPRGLVEFGVKLREPVAFFTFLIFVSTTAYVIVSYYQLRATNDALIITQRAWVLVRDMKSPATIERGKPFSVEIILENFGHSPAMDMVTGATGLAADGPFPKRPPWPEYKEPPGLTLLGPGQPTRVPVPVTNMPADVVDDINARKTGFYIYGVVRYTDPFGTRGETKFCGRFSGDRSFGFCSTHNEAK